jgi:hypothetical protein
MATAPRPGAQRAQSDATKRYRIRVRERTLEFPTALTIEERFTIRNVTGGISLEALFQYPGQDLGAVLWWLARRRNGEPRVSLSEAAAELVGLTDDEFDFEIVSDSDEESDDPE